MKKLIAGCAAVLLATLVYASQYPNIEINDLKAKIASKQVTLLDANGSDSWKEGHIPGAIDFQSHRNDLGSVLPKDKDALIVAYCGGPKCGAYAAAAKAAEKLGYTNVKHLTAGISGWKEAGLKTERGS